MDCRGLGNELNERERIASKQVEGRSKLEVLMATKNGGLCKPYMAQFGNSNI